MCGLLNAYAAAVHLGMKTGEQLGTALRFGDGSSFPVRVQETPGIRACQVEKVGILERYVGLVGEVGRTRVVWPLCLRPVTVTIWYPSATSR